MGARLRVFLKEEEERTLKEMRQAENLGKRPSGSYLSKPSWLVCRKNSSLSTNRYRNSEKNAK